MRKNDKLYITIIILIVCVMGGINIALLLRDKKVTYINTSLYSENDSLKLEIIKSDAVIKSRYNSLDSLVKSKQVIQNYYETNIQNLSDSSIVSDDSISSFIRSQIYK